MERIALYKDLSLDTVDLRNLIQEIADKKLSGYFQISYWNSDDYLLYTEGDFFWGVSVDRDGTRREITAQNYKPKSTEGSISFYQVPVVNLLIFRHQYNTPPNPYNFAGYGQEFLACIKLSHIDIYRLMEQIERAHIDGYLVMCSKERFILTLMFQKGLPVCSYYQNLYTLKSAQKIRLQKDDTYVAVYATEPELPIIMSSMDTLRKEKEGTVDSEEELTLLKKEISGRKLSALFDLIFNGGKRLYEFFYRGVSFLKLLHHMEKIETANPSITLGVKNHFSLYSLEVKESLQPIHVEFYEDTGYEYVKEEKVNAVKLYFIEEIGPIGSLLWNKILKDRGYREKSMREEDLKSLIDVLYKEIPDSMHANRFLEKVRRVVE
jgi:hypothetical protein